MEWQVAAKLRRSEPAGRVVRLVGMRLAIVALLLVGCGHTMRTGAGPLVDSDGRPGLVASAEVGTHLIGAKEVAMPIGFRVEAAATTDGVQVLLGIAYGATLPPGGRRIRNDENKQRGWGGRFAFASGALVDKDGGAFGLRSGFALTRGSIERGKRDGGCSGHEKMSWCYSWQRFKYAHTGIEIATTARMVGDDDDQLKLAGWRISAELVYERGTLSDLSLH
jgi:hypothetical protein